MPNEGSDRPVRPKTRYDVNVIGQNCNLVYVHAHAASRVLDGVDHARDVYVTNAPDPEPRVPSDMGVNAEGLMCHSALG